MKRINSIIATVIFFMTPVLSLAEEVCKTATDVPAISNMEYMKARAKLTTSGWKPLHTLLNTKNNPTLSIASSLIDNGVIEILGCNVQRNECEFSFRDKSGNLLALTSHSGFEHVVQRTNLLCLSERKDWDERASIISKLLVKVNESYLAQKIQGYTHPSGNSPSIIDTQVAKYGDHVSVEITVQWHGGFTGTAYSTTVAWNFNANEHLSATVKSDTASIAAAPQNVALMNNFFRDDIYHLAHEAFEE